MRLLRSFRYAFAGMVYLLRTQPNARIHLAATVLVIAVGACLKLNPVEWSLIVLSMASVWVTESINTAIETLADRVTTERDPQIKIAKDVAAAATLFAAIGAAVVGVLIFGSKWLSI